MQQLLWPHVRYRMQVGGKVIEGLARFIFQQLVIALDFCHRKGKVGFLPRGLLPPNMHQGVVLSCVFRSSLETLSATVHICNSVHLVQHGLSGTHQACCGLFQSHLPCVPPSHAHAHADTPSCACHAMPCMQVNRDIKLSNILLSIAEGQLPLVKLADFGFSKDTYRHSEPHSQVRVSGCGGGVSWLGWRVCTIALPHQPTLLHLHQPCALAHACTMASSVWRSTPMRTPVPPQRMPRN